MPEHVSGPSGVPARRDSERGIKDTLARLEEQLAALTIAVTNLADRFADAEAEAEEILRRAAATPPAGRPAQPARHTAARRGRRGDTVLRVIKAAAFFLALSGLVLAAMAPRHLWEQRYSPRCSAACARPVSNPSSTHRPAAK